MGDMGDDIVKTCAGRTMIILLAVLVAAMLIYLFL